MNYRRVCFIATLLLSFSISAAADVNTLKNQCNGCHGENGVSRWTDMPTIAGIDAFVHSEALYIYRDEARPCADSEFRTGDTSRAPTNMCDIAAGLDDDQIGVLSEYYAALPFVAAKQDFDAALAAAGKTIHERDCEMCHTDGGSDPEDESSILAGQWTGYLRSMFVQYRAGEREQPERMQEKLEALSDDEVEALLNYYASLQ